MPDLPEGIHAPHHILDVPAPMKKDRSANRMENQLGRKNALPEGGEVVVAFLGRAHEVGVDIVQRASQDTLGHLKPFPARLVDVLDPLHPDMKPVGSRSSEHGPERVGQVPACGDGIRRVEIRCVFPTRLEWAGEVCAFGIEMIRKLLPR